MTKKVKQKILYFLPVLIAGIFIAMALTPVTSGGQSQIQPTTTTTTANPFQGQPIVSENTNVTWSVFNQTMAPNEYLNSTGHPEYINAEPSTFYQNYISINPSHIIAPKVLQNDDLGELSTPWDASLWSASGSTTNLTVSTSWANVSNMGEVKLTASLSGTHSDYNPIMTYVIPSTNYSSPNPEYDYITYVISVSLPTNSGADVIINAFNSTGSNVGISPYLGTGTYFETISLATINNLANYYTEFNTTAGEGYSSSFRFIPTLEIPSGAPDGTYSMTVNALAMTTYPITFGSNETGTTLTQSQGNLRLAEFHPDNINNVSVVNDGYSEALSMPTQMSENFTQTQNQITGSNYIEETTEQGNLLYPTGTDISYSGSNVSAQLNGIPASQIPLLNVNGVSFSTKISNLSGNSTTLTTTNPNQPVNVIYQVEYTASQWNSFTAPPFFLSVQGIEYYWWIGLIAIFGGLGIFAGLRSYATGKEEDLRAPPKVR